MLFVDLVHSIAFFSRYHILCLQFNSPKTNFHRLDLICHTRPVEPLAGSRPGEAPVSERVPFVWRRQIPVPGKVWYEQSR